MTYPLFVLPPPVVALKRIIPKNVLLKLFQKAQNSPLNRTLSFDVPQGRFHNHGMYILYLHLFPPKKYIKSCWNNQAVLSAPLLVLALTFDSQGREHTCCHGDPKPPHSRAERVGQSMVSPLRTAQRDAGLYSAVTPGWARPRALIDRPEAQWEPAAATKGCSTMTWCSQVFTSESSQKQHSTHTGP